MAAKSGRDLDHGAQGIRVARRTLTYIVRVLLMIVVGCTVDELICSDEKANERSPA